MTDDADSVIELTPRNFALVCPEGHALPVPDNWREIWGTDTVRCRIHDQVMVETPTPHEGRER